MTSETGTFAAQVANVRVWDFCRSCDEFTPGLPRAADDPQLRSGVPRVHDAGRAARHGRAGVLGGRGGRARAMNR